MEEENDSDKENKDPSSIEVLQLTPQSKKRRGKRKKEKAFSYFGPSAFTYPLNLCEGSFIFMKGLDVWQPGKIMQVTSPYNIICYSFLDCSLSITSRSKLCSFLNYGCKVDFDLVDSEGAYRKGIIECITSFAEIHRPDLLKLHDKENMLLDWARLGFIGCELLQNNIPQILVDYKTDRNCHSPNVDVDDEQPSTSQASAFVDCATPDHSNTEVDICTPSSSKKRKLSLQTDDSGYSSPDRLLKSPLATLSLDDIPQSGSRCVDTGSEISAFVLGKLPRYGWWPGLIADPRKSPRPCLQNERLVYWFGDCTKSVIDIKDVVPITKFSDVYQPSKKGVYRIALYDFLSDAAESCNFTDVNAPDSVNIDETALSGLVQWALNGFIPGGPPNVWGPTDHYMTDRRIDTKIRKVDASKVKSGAQLCVACGEAESQHLHPLFEGDNLCNTCLQDFSQCAFVFGEDGTGNYCSVCNHGGSLFICDESQCGRPYCAQCIARVCGPELLLQVEKSDPWFCVLCCETGRMGKLKRRADWQDRLHGLLTRRGDGEDDYETPAPPPMPPISQRRPIRVLSLFDGISTGLVVLKNIGFQIERYVSSEVDADSLTVSQIHHPEVLQIGDIRALTRQQISELGSFDLVIGGSPCNDLSNVNPARKGIYEGTGRLFFEFYRILNYVTAGQKQVFWLFENVVSMSQEDRSCISRFLQCNPVVIDAKHVSCMSRARYFWGNLPGMSRTVLPLESDKLTLQECLETNCGRIARFKKINCITTKLTSVKQRKGRTLPVMISGDDLGPGDWLWCTEMERVFGLEPHYTDVANMSRQGRQRLLGKAWSVPAMRHLFSPLRDYFKCQR